MILAAWESESICSMAQICQEVEQKPTVHQLMCPRLLGLEGHASLFVSFRPSRVLHLCNESFWSCCGLWGGQIVSLLVHTCMHWNTSFPSPTPPPNVLWTPQASQNLQNPKGFKSWAGQWGLPVPSHQPAPAIARGGAQG